MTRRPTRRRIATVLLLPAAALMLVGCGSIQEAVDSAQGAVDAAQSVVEAPQRIGEACVAAIAALAPGQPAAEADAALDRATALLDDALGGAAALPGIAQLREAFVSAGESVASGMDPAATESTRTALTAACSAFSGQ